jgi:protein-S-isoprenylcysteine O-methyltransferase Ste14
VKITSAAIGTAIFTLVVPAVVAGLVPQRLAPLDPVSPLYAQMPGWTMLVLGTLGYLWCAADFVRFGLGTPAPVAAPDRLVVRGLYRYTRNPMYVSVLLAVIGQALLRWSGTVLGYAFLLFVVLNLFVRLYEEPTLARKFGQPYLDYRTRVPRWLR